MKAAVFSDTHSNTALMVEAVRRVRPDVIIHLGDHDRDTAILRREFPEIPLYGVCGNCDYGSAEPAWDVVPLGPVKAYITHGHLLNVRWGVDSLVYAAQEQGCKLALYGHTHEADIQEIGGVKVMNPGTAGMSRKPTWGWIQVFDNGGIALEIREL
jgi:putative phosphoesterase